MARVWQLASGDLLVVPDDTKGLVIVSHAVPLGASAADLLDARRSSIEALERGMRAVDEGKTEELFGQILALNAAAKTGSHN